jgi:type IV pilus assembly protein PilB
LKVLIAEDDAASREILRRTVEKLGHECLASKDGFEAWQSYQKTPDVDVIVSDRMMPNMDGLELCRRVRGLPRGERVFFVFLTALGGEEHLLEGIRAGGDEYLTKPLDSEQLRAKLDTASSVASLHRRMDAEDEDGGAVRALDAGKAPGAGTLEPIRSQKPRVRPNVWEALITQGKLTEEQLHRALEAQKGGPTELGKTLVALGFISEADLARAQAQRLNLNYVELTEAQVDREAAGLVPEQLLRRHNALPLYMENGCLVVAMSNPTDVYALDDLKMASGCPIVPVVTTLENVQRMQARVFSTGEHLTGILQEAVEPEVEDQGELELGTAGEAGEAPVIRLVSSILQRAVGEEASDVHLEPQAQGLKVRLRVDGVLGEFMSVPPGLQAGVISRVKILANLDISEKRVPQDGRFSVSLGGTKVDLRVATLPTIFGEEVVMRLLDTSNLQTDLAALGFSARDLDRYREVFERPYGTILVTGPTGSGKSTTLYATLNRLNSPQRKIITIEDPVEYRMPGINQIQVNPKAGLTFASGLRSILRNDPDVVMVGEIRDPETAKTGVEAALTGHLVLATLHTNDAPSAVTRLTEMGVEPFLTSSAVDCVIAQRLARKLCERCKEPARIDREILEGMSFPVEQAPEELRFHRAVGCDWCGGTGYRGRLGLYEVMVVTDEIKQAILRRVSAGEIGRAAEASGMLRLRDDGLIKAARGLTSVEEVLRAVV